MTRAGMVFVRLDPSGRVWFFEAKPSSQVAVATGPAAPDWSAVLSRAGLDPARLAQVDPLWTPPEPFDTRRAWTKNDLRVEAPAFGGRFVWLEVIPSSKPVDAGAPSPLALDQAVQTVLPPVLRLIVILFAAFLARRNLKAGRGDLRGALRLAAVFLALGTAIDLLATSSSVSAVAAIWANNLSLRLFTAALIWLGYLAVEPYVRRLWPHALIAWTRVIDGRLRDPLVGRDLLVGGVAGILSTAVFLLPWTAPWLGLPPPPPMVHGVSVLGGTAQWLAVLLSMALESFLVPVVYLVCLMIFRVVLRKPWLAIATFFLVVAVLQFVLHQDIPLAGLYIAATLCLGTIGLIVLTRFGLFAFLVTVFFSSWERLVLTTDPGSWYFGPSALTMALFAAIAVYGFRLSVGGQLTFRDPVLDEA